MQIRKNNSAMKIFGKRIQNFEDVETSFKQILSTPVENFVNNFHRSLSTE
ncbi:hypothetical protein HMPREF0733_10960 [Rothia dentocariosa ATCC 17931]|uniref:Uncharacterized protein n=1 Tax=Rothia dentocariosa (strain ATCC 17931 / CDC X599 / XDIA) TaxID=762948 RepID=E3H3F4_ROTDC|nr:hypothetical protein HMPREF0733_10960 [Rothia dentocariosa ATCC 17931]